MHRKALVVSVIAAAIICSPQLLRGRGNQITDKIEFHTSARCIACHNGVTTPSGLDVSVGFDWQSSIMANSSRDPYWQASARRETIDHAVARLHVEDECSICHMPIPRYLAKLQGQDGQIFSHIPFNADKKEGALAEDGVTCTVCHQVTKEKLGAPASFNGGFVIAPPESKMDHPEYGPFQIDAGRTRVMDTSTGGFRPTEAQHIRDSALCGTCHTLFTTALGPNGKEIGMFPEQMPFLEWQHSDYPNRYSCQQCHMPEVEGEAPLTSVLPQLRPGVHQHVFVGGNFFMQRMLNLYRTDLDVAATAPELTRAAEGTQAFLQSQSARLEIRNFDVSAGTAHVDVFVQNLTGHKLPTAFPSRRAWLHLLITGRNGKAVFESGHLNPDGSIVGNDNDADKTKYEPFYHEITKSDQVQIFEPILGDEQGHVTTGLLFTVRYLKDSRLLPSGFDKSTADKNIAVVGAAADDPNFTGGADTTRYSVAIGDAQGPFHVLAELWYQPIGYRWAHNLAPYNTVETQRFMRYYESMSKTTAIVLAKAEATR
ncbi:MAG TPA: hypothetical protein VKW78_09245 [Terriglobales bacterium]|nr:hypothetical protein [Terriglobales bacterium]